MSYFIHDSSTLECIEIFILYIRYADQVSVGDEVLVPGNGELTPAKVTDVPTFKMQGLYHS